MTAALLALAGITLGPVHAHCADANATLVVDLGTVGLACSAHGCHLQEAQSPLASGQEQAALASCGENGLALVRRGNDMLLEHVHAVSEELSLGAALLEAVRVADASQASLANRALCWAAEAAVPEAPAMAKMLATRPDAALRSAAALALATRPEVWAVGGLWLLAHDAAFSVRRAALDGVEKRCASSKERACLGLLAMFVRDPHPEVAWHARDLLLSRAPRVALLGAPSTYKLDAIAQLTVRRQRDGDEAIAAALRLLIADTDPEVRRAARLLAGDFDP